MLESSIAIKSENKSEMKEKSPDASIPKPPARRKSKLNTAAIEEVLRNQPQTDLDVPPALPLKKKDISPDRSAISEIYAVPEKHKKEEKSNVPDAPAPSKPPRLNLSPTIETEKQPCTEIDNKKLLNVDFSKEASPVTSLSNESDSNCFADSESDPEIKIIRQKYMHRKAPKYENEEEDLFEESFAKQEEVDTAKALRHAVEEAKGFDFNPELPIPGSRGSRSVDDMSSPKAFREGSARPLQLFPVSKQEAPPAVVNVETKPIEKDTVEMPEKQIRKHLLEKTEQSVTSDMLPNETEKFTISSEVPVAPMQSIHVDPYYDNIQETEQIQEVRNTEEAFHIPQEKIDIRAQEIQLPTSPEVSHSVEDTLPETYQTSFQPQPEDNVVEEEESLLLELDAMPAAAEYFFLEDTMKLL
ncbi:RBR-type E3 ubiquitin transferase [Caerostris extrusa]|uniref:RBR-type E3 ubiquitin transferase n=1 Tax=Caerostris extrusa TaxID=172846 RepID=A0AAV4UPL7_CAEEX|nr:RBR-type E3 ubiquitin transferase [Caerostris extrusa]